MNNSDGINVKYRDTEKCNSFFIFQDAYAKNMIKPQITFLI